ncbi:MAG: hypothetical protein RQ750_16610, partial [Roseovarius sp.]|nr:hypothetical protein [Roseovarius sp.]
MSKIERLTIELCNEMMDAVAKGQLETVTATAVSIIEYSGYELARQGRTSSSIVLFQAARFLEERVSAEGRAQQAA